MFANTLLMALRAIRRNTLRSVLTILGIVIGVAAVVALVTIGQGATAQVANEIGSMGHNLLNLRPGAGRGPGGAMVASTPFTLRDAEAIAREITGLDHVAPVSSNRALVVSGNLNRQVSVTGTTAEYLGSRGYRIATGREFTRAEELSGQSVCILGATVVNEFFEGSDPVGERIRVGRISCRVIGTMDAKGESAFGGDQDDVVLIPIVAFQRRIAGNQDVASISLSVSDGYSIAAVQSRVEALMRERRRIAPGADDNFHVRDMQEIAAMMQGTTTVLTTLLGAIAAVSLLVGGIGVMNIMLVSVTERTREIGVRLAIGARGREVMQQFLVEAAMLSGLGGVIGLVLGNVGGYFAARAMELPFLPSPSMAAVAFLFSVAVGIAFGFLPARKAARLNPMEALRYE